jgi:hypothetical protein
MDSAGNPAAVVVGDFNGDGIPDIAVANVGDNSVSVLLGNGDGTFQLAGTFVVGRSPDAIAVGDFNGDGIDDLVTANRGSNTVSVLLGNGDGSFQPARDSATGSVPVAVAVADFNGDGIPDLVVADFGTGFFDSNAGAQVLLGNGDGSFQPPARNFFNQQTTSVAVADFNGDAIPDFAVTEPDPGNAVVALGNGDGTFRFLSFPTRDRPNLVTVGDFNGDGIPDLVITAPHVEIGQPDHGSVYAGNGDGTFQTARNFII